MTEEDKKKKSVPYRDIWRFARHYWGKNKTPGIAAAVLMLLAVATDTVVPVYTGRMVDALTQGVAGDSSALAAAWAGFAGFTVAVLMNAVLRVSSMFFWNRFAVKNLYNIVRDGLHKVQRFSSDWHANSFAGGTVRKISRGMWSFDMFEDTLLMGILPAVTIMIGMTVMLSLSLPSVGMAAAGLILVYCLLSIWMSLKFLAPRFQASAESDTKIGAILADIITTNATVKAFGTEAEEDRLFKSVADAWYSKAYHAWQAGIAADAVRSLFRMLMTVSMIAATIVLWKTGRASPGDIALVITTFFIIGGYLSDIGRHIAHLQRAASDMEDAVSFWLRQEDVADVPGARDLTVRQHKGSDLIVFDGVGFKYPSTDKMIYQGMSVRIRAGENLALVGPSGSGKSTFVKLIQRLYDVTEGVITIDGQDIAGATLQSLRRSIALVPQDPVLFHRSLAENIAYGKKDATMEEIVEASKKAFAHDFIETLPKGYDTTVGERGVKLSGGERQRVAIARAILADAPILILDEATSSLDSISEHYIQKALEVLMEGRTTVTIAHRLSTIRRADRILVFDRGKITEQGSHDVLMMNPQSRYKVLYDMQALELVGEAV